MLHTHRRRTIQQTGRTCNQCDHPTRLVGLGTDLADRCKSSIRIDKPSFHCFHRRHCSHIRLLIHLRYRYHLHIHVGNPHDTRSAREYLSDSWRCIALKLYRQVWCKVRCKFLVYHRWILGRSKYPMSPCTYRRSRHSIRTLYLCMKGSMDHTFVLLVCLCTDCCSNIRHCLSDIR